MTLQTKPPGPYKTLKSDNSFFIKPLCQIETYILDVNLVHYLA